MSFGQNELFLSYEVQDIGYTGHNICGAFDCDIRYISITFSATFDSCINIIMRIHISLHNQLDLMVNTTHYILKMWMMGFRGIDYFYG